ncbi:MAG: Hsp20/alpha crystallin family protein [Heliobacteriaceae bacterium]|nr:Hsp20/alpha crystallin family protein [Heliobacteriaceae bacterium]
MALIRRNDPEHPLYRLQDEMNNLFNQFVEPLFGDNLTGRSWNPRINVEETPNEYIVQAELPGIDPKDVAVELHGNTLTIRGERKVEEKKEDRHRHVRELNYGSFQRSMVLPEAANTEQITAGSRHGVLTITVPKKEEKLPKRINISIDPLQ